MKFYLEADPDDGLPPIRQEISAKHHHAYTAMENILSTVKLCECQGGPQLDANGMSKATSTYIHRADAATGGWVFSAESSL